MANTIDGREFYELMQVYRFARVTDPVETAKAFQAVIAHIDKDRAERDKRIVAATVEACRKIVTSSAMSDEIFVSTACDAIIAITPESVLADIDKQEEGRT